MVLRLRVELGWVWVRHLVVLFRVTGWGMHYVLAKIDIQVCVCVCKE